MFVAFAHRFFGSNIMENAFKRNNAIKRLRPACKVSISTCSSLKEAHLSALGRPYLQAMPGCSRDKENTNQPSGTKDVWGKDLQQAISFNTR